MKSSHTRIILTAFASLLFLSCICTSNAMAQKSETFTYVKFHTNKGNFTVKLYNDTPIHKENFIKLVKDNHYDNLLFHRVIRSFMVQAGGEIRPVPAARKRKYEAISNETIPAEILYPTHFHKRGALAAARVGDEQNPERRSDALQFYVVVGQFYLEKELEKMEKAKNIKMTDEIKKAYMTEGGTPHLDNAYTVFGEVVDGMDVILKIQQTETNPEDDKPLKDIYIKKTELSEK